MDPLVLPFVAYAAVTTFTPGPNNISSAAVGMRLGFARTAYERIGDKATFLLYERELFKNGYWTDIVDLWRETQGAKAGFLEGIFGADRVRDAGMQMEEAEGELRRIGQSINDLQGKESELQREDSKLIGTGSSDYRTNLQHDIDRVRNAVQRERERSGELWKRMATVLSGLFGQG
jgi:hypothetical protein